MTQIDHNPRIVVMGVAGSGKTTIGSALAERLGLPYADADEFHPAANVAKMRAGHPLDDADRCPWLDRLSAWIGEHEAAGRSAVLTCSALKRRYRDRLRVDHDSVWFARVDVPEAVLVERVAARSGHYMPSSLVHSQIADLEPLDCDEPGITVPGIGDVDSVVDAVLAALARDRRG